MRPFPRHLGPILRKIATQYPVVTLTGPRQSGKTTLCVSSFPHRKRVSLEPFDNRKYAQEDPRGFLQEHAEGAILDEIQHAPELLSYLQEDVDQNPQPGRFILTGSEHLSISNSVAQSLAGRSAVLHLLPLSHAETRNFPIQTETLFESLFMGGYPRIRSTAVSTIEPQRWMSDYITNYVQRDVRQLLKIVQLDEFTTFLKLCAAQSGQELNLSRLGADTGISHNTAKAWLSVLKASFLCFTLPAWTPNIRKQLVKAPKLHFFDSGLQCHLLGIRDPEELRHHPLRGAIFESWVASELYKKHVHHGETPSLHHFRQSRGSEVDILEFVGETLTAYEVKSGQTLRSDSFKSLAAALDSYESVLRPTQTSQGVVVYGGDTTSQRHGIKALPWSKIG